MQYELLHPGSNAVILASLEPGEKLKAEAGAMVAKSARLSVTGSMWGGTFRAIRRWMLGGESFFFMEISADGVGGEVLIAPATPGDVKILPLKDGQDYYVQNGCLLAAFDDVTMDTRAQRLTAGLFSGAGIFVLHLKGYGSIAVSSFGAILEIPIPAGDEYVIDNGHLVAWSGDTEYKIVKIGRTWMSTFTSGEGLGCQFSGPGENLGADKESQIIRRMDKTLRTDSTDYFVVRLIS